MEILPVYLLVYLLIIVRFDDGTIDVIVLFIFNLTLPYTFCVTCSVTMLLSFSHIVATSKSGLESGGLRCLGGALISLPTLKLHVFRELKQAIINAWQELSQLFINRSINEWRRRLECVV